MKVLSIKGLSVTAMKRKPLLSSPQTVQIVNEEGRHRHALQRLLESWKNGLRSIIGVSEVFQKLMLSLLMCLKLTVVQLDLYYCKQLLNVHIIRTWDTVVISSLSTTIADLSVTDAQSLFSSNLELLS